jgi:hypothetical protein
LDEITNSRCDVEGNIVPQDGDGRTSMTCGMGILDEAPWVCRQRVSSPASENEPLRSITMTDEKRKKIEDAARAVFKVRERIDAMRLQPRSNDPVDREQQAVDMAILDAELMDAEHALFWAGRYDDEHS